MSIAFSLHQVEWLQHSYHHLNFLTGVVQLFHGMGGLFAGSLRGGSVATVMTQEADESTIPPRHVMPAGIHAPAGPPGVRATTSSRAGVAQRGALIINADDWGRDRENTDRTLRCVARGTVSSVSAMVFMEDSERAAALAQEREVDAGLHLNFTAPFSGSCYPARLIEHQNRIANHLVRHRFSPLLYHPGLARSFEFVVAAQLDEYARLYGARPTRLDGHHHMHLCANVLFGKLVPAGTTVRRNFTFQSGEKGWHNRLYRSYVDHALAKRHPLADCLFSLAPLEPRARLDRIFARARQSVVELETHPINPEEYRFLAEGEILRRLGDIPIAPRYTTADALPSRNTGDRGKHNGSE